MPALPPSLLDWDHGRALLLRPLVEPDLLPEALREGGLGLTEPSRREHGLCHLPRRRGGAERDFVFRTNVRFLPGQYGRSDPVEEGEIEITRMGFQGGNRTVPVGTTVVWKNSTIERASVHRLRGLRGGIARGCQTAP